MPHLLYKIERALFGQPISVTAAVLRSRLRSVRGGRNRPSGTDVARTHPIDELYGIETSGVISPGKIRSGSRSDIYSIGYGGVQPSALRNVINKIPELETACFLDIGCGKGRALAVATEFPFARVLGVELAPALSRIAKRNAAIMATCYPDRTPIEIIEGDALAFELPAGFIVAFIYNPGYKPLVKGLAARFAAHQHVQGNRILVVYCNPILGDIFDGQPAFERYYAGRHALDENDLANYGETENSIVIWKAKIDTRLCPHPGANAKIHAGPAHAVVGTIET